MKKKVLISTGGSGGHVIPATIFYDHLKDNFDLFIFSDKRGCKFLNEKKYPVNVINTPQLKLNILTLPFNLIKISILIIKSLIFIKKNNIDILISTGGYMSLPLCIASKLANIDIYLFEPNMVLGRLNNIFLKFSKKIFCYSSDIKNFPQRLLKKIELIEPMLRKEFYSIKKDKSISIKEKINLLIIGGSQGAKLFDFILKETTLGLSKKYQLKVFHQTNISNYGNLKYFYNKHNITSELFDFDEDVIKYIKDANLAITRAGASTLSELTFLNIPFLAIPLPTAKDDHQYQNALFYKNKNYCWLLKEDLLNQESLMKILQNIIENYDDYLNKKTNMKNFSYQNTWNKINQKLISTINEY